MKKIVLITALAAGLITQQTQCWNWKYVAAGTGVLAIAGLGYAYYMGWFNTETKNNKNTSKIDSLNKETVYNTKNQSLLDKDFQEKVKLLNDELSSINPNELKTNLHELKTFLEQKNNETPSINKIETEKDTKIEEKIETNETVDENVVETWANRIESIISNPTGNSSEDTKNLEESIEQLCNKVYSNEFIKGVLTFTFRNKKNLLTISKNTTFSTTIEQLYKKYAPDLLPKKENNKSNDKQTNLGTNNKVNGGIQNKINQLNKKN